MPASKFVELVQREITKRVARSGNSGWIDLLAGKVMIEFKDLRDLDLEEERRKFEWKQDVFKALFRDDVILLSVICNSGTFTFDLIALNDFTKATLGAETVKYSHRPESYLHLEDKLRHDRRTT